MSDLPFLLAAFARSPVGAMKIPMRLSWPAALSLQAGIAMVSGALFGAINKNFWDVLLGVLVFPVTSIAMSLLFSVFLYQFFSVFRATFLEFRRLYSIVVVATVPYFLLHVAAGFLAPIDLIGFGLTTILLIVGLVEQFGLDRKLIIRVMSGVYALFFVAWMMAQLSNG